MTIEMAEPRKAKIIKANYDLQAKVGTGTLDSKVVEACEQVIQNNTIDFGPMAKEFLDKLKVAIDHARKGEVSTKDALQQMAQPVMELKANATTFKYDLIGSLANVMLSFLENLQDMDKDAIEIVDAHHKTLSLIIIKKMSGNGGAQGKILEQELKDACARYMNRKK